MTTVDLCQITYRRFPRSPSHDHALEAECDSWTFAEVVMFVDSQSERLPETCPGCGTALVVTAVYLDPDENVVAARLTCMRLHDENQIVTYIYEPTTDELYLELEAEPQDDHWHLGILGDAPAAVAGSR